MPVAPRAFLTVRPLDVGPVLPQSQGIAWMKAALARVAAEAERPEATRAARFYDLLARQSGVESRATCLADYGHTDWARMRLHAPGAAGEPWYAAPLGPRMDVFAETALAAAQQAFPDGGGAPDALVQVSCTGYDSPHAVQRVAAERGWTAARVLHLGHMGCYAALPALETAADLVGGIAARSAPGGGGEGRDARAAVLLVELCTLHHDPTATDVEQVVQQCLFADGAAVMNVTAHAPPGRSLAFLDAAETTIPGTLGEMTWRSTTPAFRMTLSRAVPDHVRAHVGPAVEAFLARHGLGVADVHTFAVHPGGPRVIESTAEALGLAPGAVADSQEVLRTRGNMSSATLPHIWARLLEGRAVPAGARVVSVAFGPGLTVALNLLEMHEA